MTNLISKPFDTPDESRTPDKTSVQVVDLGDVKAARMTLEPGWEVGPGAAYRIEPGHDAWVVGSEPFVGYEFESTTAGSYAAPS